MFRLVRKYSDKIHTVFINEENDTRCLVEKVCVDITRHCSKGQFKKVSGHLEHEHDWTKRQRVLNGLLAGGEHLEL